MIAKPPYYKVRRNRGFFELGKERGERVGMAASIPMGRDCVSARAEAAKLYARWKTLSNGSDIDPQPDYPPGSLGSWFNHYRTTPAWAMKASATRQEWENMWRFIGSALGKKPIRAISPAEFATFYISTEERYGHKTRWRVVKVSRALFRSALDNRIIQHSPANVLPNNIPMGRKEIWLASEVLTLMETAARLNRPAMRLAIWIGWQTLFQPGDVRALTLANRYRSRTGAYLVIQRAKTGRDAHGAISDDLSEAIDAYVASLPVQVLPGQPFLRTTRGHEYLKVRFMADFDLVRRAAFGPDETRRFQDIRRSGNVEADLGGASPEDRAEILANNLHKNPFLEATYTPPTVAKARQIQEKRLVGRALLANARVNLAGQNDSSEDENESKSNA